MQLILLELVKSNRDSVRKAGEADLIKEVKPLNLMVLKRNMKLSTFPQYWCTTE